MVIVDFEVTITVAVHNTPGVNPAMFTLLSALTLEFEVENTEELSASFVTSTFTVTPAAGSTEVTFTTIGCDVPTTPKILPAPGSLSTVKAIVASVGVGGVGGLGAGVSPPLLQEENIKGRATNKNLIAFIIDNKDSNFYK